MPHAPYHAALFSTGLSDFCQPCGASNDSYESGTQASSAPYQPLTLPRPADLGGVSSWHANKPQWHLLNWLRGSGHPNERHTKVITSTCTPQLKIAHSRHNLCLSVTEAITVHASLFLNMLVVPYVPLVCLCSEHDRSTQGLGWHVISVFHFHQKITKLGSLQRKFRLPPLSGHRS